MIECLTNVAAVKNCSNDCRCEKKEIISLIMQKEGDDSFLMWKAVSTCPRILNDEKETCSVFN